MAKTKNLSDYICVFPDLEYRAEVPPLDVIAPSSAMMTIIERHGGRPDFAAAVTPHGSPLTMVSLEKDIVARCLSQGTASPCGTMEDIFHMIQLWGGEHGRYIYVQGPAFDWEEIRPAYARLAAAAADPAKDEESMMRKARAFTSTMQDQGRRLGLSFVTKHVWFWNHAAAGDDALPVFDTYMAKGLKLRPVWEHLALYWRSMRKKAAEEGITVAALERQLFNHFRKQNQL